MRTIDDVIPKVSDAFHFSILDAQSGFWQVDSMGQVTCSGDMFQEKMDKVFGNLDGLRMIPLSVARAKKSMISSY